MTCQLCLQGYTNTGAGCAPCSKGCQVCNPILLTECTTCSAGYYLNTTNNVCTPCTSNCLACTPIGCMVCTINYVLNQDFTCQMPCMTPCATCSTTNPLTCFSCVQGYVMSNGQCVASTSCNNNSGCTVCPFGFAIMMNNNNVRLNQSCVQCTASSNCARCNVSAPAQCYSCLSGSYLNGTICSSCASGCSQCISLNMCTMCALGFIPQQSGTLLGNAATGVLTCTACTTNCATCLGSPSTCTSCISGFTLNGVVCTSNFNFQVSITLGVTIQVFTSNYVAFMNQIASAAGVTVNNIVVLSIVSGSVSVNMLVNSDSAPGSVGATNALNNLNSVLKAGGSIANMGVASSTITTNGDNSDNSGGGLSTTTIIILAVVIPVGVLCNSQSI